MLVWYFAILTVSFQVNNEYHLSTRNNLIFFNSGIIIHLSFKLKQAGRRSFVNTHSKPQSNKRLLTLFPPKIIGLFVVFEISIRLTI